MLYYKYYFLSLVIIIIFSVIVYCLFFMKANDDNSSFLKNTTFIGHGMYGIDSVDYTNSIQALELGYNNGIKIMEVDFLFTSDGELVLNHYWENDTWETKEEFLNKKIRERYTTMDIDDLLVYMDNYQDLYIVIDTKENEYDNGKSVLDVYEYIINKTKAYDEKLLDRFIIQLYNFSDYDEIRNMHDFEHKMFTMYKLGTDFNVLKIVYYCLLNDIDSIVFPYTHIFYNIINEEDIRLIRSKNINVYVNTINDMDTYKMLLDMGVTGVYTDFLS